MEPHPDFARIDVPQRFSLDVFHMDILTAAHVQEDYEAVMGAARFLQDNDGTGWPNGLTLSENETDLHWHHREFTTRRSFAWIIRDRDGQYLGCAYIYPDIGMRGCITSRYWIADLPDRDAVRVAFGTVFEPWVRDLASAGSEITFYPV